MRKRSSWLMVLCLTGCFALPAKDKFEYATPAEKATADVAADQDVADADAIDAATDAESADGDVTRADADAEILAPDAEVAVQDSDVVGTDAALAGTDAQADSEDVDTGATDATSDAIDAVVPVDAKDAEGDDGKTVDAQVDVLADETAVADDATDTEEVGNDATDDVGADAADSDTGQSDPCLTLNCNDGNACTDDSCTAGVGCSNVSNVGNPCTDGKTCTTDACVSGNCVSTKYDNNCSDGKPCTDDSCNPASGDATTGCVFTANNANACTDGKACTADACLYSSCVSSKVDGSCSDGKACTDDTCDPAVGDATTGCVFTVNNANVCTDGRTCTTDACASGACVSTKVDGNCTDGKLCTDDTCSPASGDVATGCVFTANNTNACSDGRSCTTDACVSGDCVSTKVDAVCSDGKPCTDDACNPASGDAATGCAFVANNLNACTDGKACTADACVGGACVSNKLDGNCSDGKPCTDDACNPASGDPATGCVFAIDNTNTCSDGKACTADACVTGTCVSTKVDGNCSDGKACTSDTCNPASGDPTTGCVFTIDNTNTCTDGKSCTTDACSGGSCVSIKVDSVCSDGNVCTNETCNPNGGGADALTGCVVTNNSATCPDADPCTVDACSGGSCQHTAVMCGTNATCGATTGTCSCNPGFWGDGSSCTCGGTMLSSTIGGVATNVCAYDWPVWGSRALSPNTYTVNGDGTVSDSQTQLMWQQVTSGTYTWTVAKTYCDGLTLAGHDDWRLPTMAEAESLYDYALPAPAINAAAFPGATSGFYWTSLVYLLNDSNNWCGIFQSDSSTGVKLAATPAPARCVRSVAALPAPSKRFTVYGTGTDGTVLDNAVGLLWQQSMSSNTLTWSASAAAGSAQAYCGALSLGAQTSGWRVPSVRELLSLVDRTTTTPAINAAAFPGTPSMGLSWTATIPAAGSLAWTISFYEGTTFSNAPSSAMVRCVHDTTCPGGCDDSNACTTDVCVIGTCTHTAITCGNNATCDATAGCVCNSGFSGDGTQCVCGGTVSSTTIGGVATNVCAYDWPVWGERPDTPNTYTVNGNGTVSDTQTKLMWQQVTGEYQAWAAAATYCDGLTLAGHDDWRLPTVAEGETLVNYASDSPMIDANAFPNALANRYWTSVAYTPSAGQSWAVSLRQDDGGGPSPYATSVPLSVRCVRATGSFSPPSPRFTVGSGGTGVARDNATGLYWQQAAPTPFPWSAVASAGSAQAYCATLSLGNYSSGWRLPTERELIGLAERALPSPSINVTVFPNSTAEFWSGTPWFTGGRAHTSVAWLATTNYQPFYFGMSVRCVFEPGCAAGCNDSNACTSDACIAGACTHTPIKCGENATCDATAGCVCNPGFSSGNTCTCGGTISSTTIGGVATNVCAYDYPVWGNRPDSPNTYTVNGDGTVSDSQTKLMWQQVTDGNTYTWANAGPYCDGLTLAGHDDWRLPTVAEGESLYDYTLYAPAISATAFPGAMSGAYWTSVVLAGGAGFNWYVTLVSAQSVTSGTATTARTVRCVRANAASTPPAARFVVSGTSPSATVLDNGTGLIWQQTVSASSYAWSASAAAGSAQAYCNGLSLNGYASGWRLPTERELFSVVDRAVYNPPIDAAFFPGTPVGWFWSATPWFNGQTSWLVAFDAGYSSDHDPASTLRVRCVHTGTCPQGCDDSNACTTDACTGGTCTHTAITCGTNATCGTTTGCVCNSGFWGDGQTCTCGGTINSTTIGGVATNVCAYDYPVWGNRPDSPNTFTVDSNGTVSDSQTKLMWQQVTDGNTYLWADAGPYCDSLTLAGHDDWRLPTVAEGESLYDYTLGAPAINATAFPGATNGPHWTSVAYVGGTGYSWYVTLATGQSFNYATAATARPVRCVRANSTWQPPVTRFTVSGTDPLATVLDSATGLNWQQTVSGSTYTWSATAAAGSAQAYCSTLSLNGFTSGWRVPTERELFSLVDRTVYSPAIAAVFFPSTPVANFWSVTPWVSGGSAWLVPFYDGSSYYVATSYPHRVRCVR